MKNIIDISIDLETLDTKPTAAILAIGIIDSHGCRVHVLPSVSEQLQTGRTLSDDTLAWWLRQSDAAREALQGERISLAAASKAVTSYFKEAKEVYGEYRVWGNAPSFDCDILGHFLGAKQWPFYLERDVRTAREVLSSRTAPDTAHSALSDARAQLKDVLRYRDLAKLQGDLA